MHGNAALKQADGKHRRTLGVCGHSRTRGFTRTQPVPAGTGKPDFTREKGNLTDE